jgi:hypothetical protein
VNVHCISSSTGEAVSTDIHCTNTLSCTSNLNQAALADPDRPFASSPGVDSESEDALDEEVRQYAIRGEHQAYTELLQDGGQPTHKPDNTGSEYLQNSAFRTDIISYWIFELRRVEWMLREQRYRWERFRVRRDERRKRYWKPEWFEKFALEVQRYRLAKNLELPNTVLLQDRKSQFRLQDWVEYQYIQYKRADKLSKDLDNASKAYEAEKENPNKGNLTLLKDRLEGAEIDLQRQRVLLKWVDEQVRIIGSESPAPEADDTERSSTKSILGKRKRPAIPPGYECI